MFSQLFKVFTYCATLVFPTFLCAQNNWQQLTQGISYQKVSDHKFRGLNLHLFKVDPNKYQLDLAFAKDYGVTRASIKKLAEDSDALIAINGGFFSPQSVPLGLRIKNKQQRSKLKNISWWGVLTQAGNTTKVVSRRRYKPSRKIDFAVQAGPRLLINGKIPKLKNGYAERSAICVTKKGNVIIAATQNSSLSTTEFAKVLKNPKYLQNDSCYNALNLDGGSSTQLYAKVGDLQLLVPNFSLLTDAVVVTKR